VFVLITCLGLGGHIMVPAARAQEAITVSLTLDAVTLGELGTIVVAGTVTCSEPAVPSVWAQVIQPVRRLHTVTGSGLTELNACDVTPLPFEIVAVPSTGRFAPGIAYVTVSGVACTADLSCYFSDMITHAFRLTW